MVDPSSPQPSRRRGALVALTVALAVLLTAAAGLVAVRQAGDDNAAQSSAAPTSTAPARPESPSTTAGPGLTPEQAATVETLKAQVSAIRGLAWRRALDVEIVSEEELARRVREYTETEREENRDRLAGDEATLKLLGLIPDRADYADIIDDLLSGGVLGFYDDETKELVVAGEPGEDLDAATRSVMAHELTHALTDQHFDYGPPTKALEDANKTEELAGYVALLEGDAELVASLWAERHLSERQRKEASGQSGGNPLAGLLAPSYVLDALRFPYEDGLAFVERQYDAGGFAAVDAAYRRPPTSTEHILHPELYASWQVPDPPTLPDLAAATGCSAVDGGALGEFDMAKVLGEHVRTARADVAAAGWNGDTFAVVRCGSALALADRWRTDGPTDAGELLQALSDWARGWSGSSRAVDADGRFTGPSGAGRVARAGNAIEIVLAEDPATADRLSRALPAL